MTQKIKSLREFCLEVVMQNCQRCLFEDVKEGDEPEKSRKALFQSGKGKRFVATGLEKENWTLMWDEPKQREKWKDVRREEMFEACVLSGKGGEARPQIIWSLAERGRLLDGVLPQDFWHDLRCDTLSLAGSRAGPVILLALAKAQSEQLNTLVSLDLGSCLLIDDTILNELAKACGSSLQRLGLRDCRKITNAVFDLVIQQLPRLIDLDVGGDFNATATAATSQLIFKLNRITSTKKKSGSTVKRARTSPETVVERRPPFLSLGISGLGADDEFLKSAASEVKSLRQLGIAYGKFTAYALIHTLPSWPHLIDLRVQWTATFDDGVLDALAAHCPRLSALDATGTSISVDAIRRFIRLRGPLIDEALLDLPVVVYEETSANNHLSTPNDDTLNYEASPLRRNLSWLSCRDTAGPKAALLKLSSAYAAVSNDIRIVLK